MNISKTRAELQAAVQSARADGKRIVLVPTMGYLHEGHLTLVDTAREHGDVVVMSIYVNPLQFGPTEDLARYPRDMARDTELARGRGVDIIFAPADAEMYGSDRPAVTVHAPRLSDRLCGLFRPGHFEGVLTVVAKLFNIVQPDAAVFGQKDFQQHVLIRRMVGDLSYPIEIIVAPIIREQDGLAMSSRNVYLSADERAAALALSRSLRVAQLRYRDGERKPAALVQSARQLLDAEKGVALQYVEVVNPASLEPPQQADDTSVMAVAAVVGKTRLIDNAILSGR
ncbi:MAG TPA: pantoate--beta-alanine ligase [Longimicrobiales bacterium]